MIKFNPVSIGELNRPVFIVGQCPGKQRKKDKNCEVFYGNRTGDFIRDILKDKTNIYLTNVFNYYVDKIDKEIIDKGLKELLNDVLTYNPQKIICLGNFSFDCISKVVKNREVFRLVHPSFILRFNKDKEKYKKQLLELIKWPENLN